LGNETFPSSTPKMAYYLRIPFYLLFNYYNSWKGIIPFSFFFSVISFIGYLILFNLIFENLVLSSLLAFINIRLQNFPYFKYNNVVFLLIPWAILFIYLILFKFNIKRKNIGLFVFWIIVCVSFYKFTCLGTIPILLFLDFYVFN